MSKETILKELKNKSEVINDSLWYANPDYVNNAIDKTREETIREIIRMCVNFDDYNNDQIISKEMLEELLNKLKK